MGLLGPEVIEQAEQIAGEILKIEAAGVIVAVAIAAGVPGDGVKMRREGFDLLGPIAAVATDPMHQHQQLAVAGVVDADLGIFEDTFGFDAGHIALVRLKRRR